jgi:hypothetical protein
MTYYWQELLAESKNLKQQAKVLKKQSDSLKKLQKQHKTPLTNPYHETYDDLMNKLEERK